MILQKIAAAARVRVAAQKLKISLAAVRAQARPSENPFAFEKALSGEECILYL